MDSIVTIVWFSCLVMSSSAAPWTTAHQASLSITNSQSWLKLMSLSWWCHPTISSSVVPFFCLQSFPASGLFSMSRLFTSGGHSIGASASASVLPMNIQGWFPLGLTGLISLLSKWLSRVFSITTIWKHQFFGVSLLYGPTLTSILLGILLFWGEIDRETVETVSDFFLGGLQNHCRWWLQPWN